MATFPPKGKNQGSEASWSHAAPGDSTALSLDDTCPWSARWTLCRLFSVLFWQGWGGKTFPFLHRQAWAQTSQRYCCRSLSTAGISWLLYTATRLPVTQTHKHTYTHWHTDTHKHRHTQTHNMLLSRTFLLHGLGGGVGRRKERGVVRQTSGKIHDFQLCEKLPQTAALANVYSTRSNLSRAPLICLRVYKNPGHKAESQQAVL